jgi:hypothetical protein
MKFLGLLVLLPEYFGQHLRFIKSRTEDSYLSNVFYGFTVPRAVE